jgi:hypothetical protein
MQRRELLRSAAAAAALTLLPRDAHAAWLRALAPASHANAASAAPAAVLSAAQRATAITVADAIMPRTDTPSASDVNVIAWIEVIAADYYTETERAALLTGLDAMDALSREMTGQPLAGLSGAPLTRVMDALDQPADRTAAAARGYVRLKGLVVHGYFTSERVQKEVLRTQIMPGHFDGAADMPARNGGRDE